MKEEQILQKKSPEILEIAKYGIGAQGRRCDSKSEGTKHDLRAERTKKIFCTPHFSKYGGTSKQMSVLNTLKFAISLSHYSGGSRHLWTWRPPPPLSVFETTAVRK